MTKPLPSVQPNSIEDYEWDCSTSFQHKFHISLSVPNIILPKLPVPPPRVQTVQPPRVDTEGLSSNLRSRGKKNPIPHFSLTAQFQKNNEANAVTHQISGFAHEYRHIIKVPDRKIWEIYFANGLGQLSQSIRTVKGTNTVIFIPKTQ